MDMPTFPFHRSLAAIVLFSLAGAMRMAGAPFDIAAQPAKAALDLFIAQSNCQVLFGFDEVRSVNTNAVKGDYSPTEAMKLLLANTGLGFRTQTADRFIVSRSPAKSGSIDGS